MSDDTDSTICAECSSLGMDGSSGPDPVMADDVPIGSLECSVCGGPWPLMHYRDPGGDRMTRYR